MVGWRLRRVGLLVIAFVGTLACFAEHSLGGIIGGVSATSTYKLIYGSTPTEESGALLEYNVGSGNNTAGKTIGNLSSIGYWTQPSESNDPFGEYANLNFSQQADLQIVAPSPFFDASADGVLSLEVRTSVKFFLTESVKISGQTNNPSGDAWTGDTSTVAGTNAFNQVEEAWFKLAYENQTPLAAGEYTLTFVSKVFTNPTYLATPGSVSVVALSHFDVTLNFTPAPVPEPTSCLVAGLLFGSVVIGQRFRRRRGV